MKAPFVFIMSVHPSVCLHVSIRLPLTVFPSN